jgi:hypothetical protein
MKFLQGPQPAQHRIASAGAAAAQNDHSVWLDTTNAPCARIIKARTDKIGERLIRSWIVWRNDHCDQINRGGASKRSNNMAQNGLARQQGILLGGARPHAQPLSTRSNQRDMA